MVGVFSKEMASAGWVFQSVLNKLGYPLLLSRMLFDFGDDDISCI